MFEAWPNGRLGYCCANPSIESETESSKLSSRGGKAAAVSAYSVAFDVVALDCRALGAAVAAQTTRDDETGVTVPAV